MQAVTADDPYTQGLQGSLERPIGKLNSKQERRAVAASVVIPKVGRNPKP